MVTKGRPKVVSLEEVQMHACSGMWQAHLEIKGGKQEETGGGGGGGGGPIRQMDAAHGNPERPALLHVLFLQIQ